MAASRADLRPEDAITGEIQQRYAADGVVVLRSVFSPEALAALATAADAATGASHNPDLEVYSAPSSHGRFVGEMDVSRKYPDFESFVFRSCAAEVAARVMGSATATFFYDFLFVKGVLAGATRQGSSRCTSRGNPPPSPQPSTSVAPRAGDNPAHGVAPGPSVLACIRWANSTLQRGSLALPPSTALAGHVCSIWLPLDPVPRASALEFVRGSHAGGSEFAPFKFATGEPYVGAEDMPRIPDIEEDRSSFDILSWDLELGDCVVFDSRIIHSAPPVHASAPRRRALSTRWAGDGCVYSLQGKCAQARTHGYPNFDPHLSEGDPLHTSPTQAFPLLYPPSHPNWVAYRGHTEAEAGRMQLQPSVDYAAARRRQAQEYSAREMH